MTAAETQQRLRVALAKAINQTAADLMAEAQREAPSGHGRLRASARIDRATPENLAASVSFNTPYAAAQHEGGAIQHRDNKIVDWDVRHHPHGGKRKYLEDPLKAIRTRYRQAITAAVARALDG